jgi:hypothetical protein
VAGKLNLGAEFGIKLQAAIKVQSRVEARNQRTHCQVARPILAIMGNVANLLSLSVSPRRRAKIRRQSFVRPSGEIRGRGKHLANSVRPTGEICNGDAFQELKSLATGVRPSGEEAGTVRQISALGVASVLARVILARFCTFVQMYSWPLSEM